MTECGELTSALVPVVAHADHEVGNQPAQSCDSDGRETATRVKNTVKTAVTTNSFILLSPLAD